MAKRPHENVSIQYFEKLSAFKLSDQGTKPISTMTTFHINLERLVDEVATHVETNGITERITSINENENIPLSRAYKQVRRDYKDLYTSHSMLTSDYESITRLETQASIRSLFFRVVTTILVGASIMGIYALAHYLEIPMPLMRMPVT